MSRSSVFVLLAVQAHVLANNHDGVKWQHLCTRSRTYEVWFIGCLCFAGKHCAWLQLGVSKTGVSAVVSNPQDLDPWLLISVVAAGLTSIWDCCMSLFWAWIFDPIMHPPPNHLIVGGGGGGGGLLFVVGLAYSWPRVVLETVKNCIIFQSLKPCWALQTKVSVGGQIDRTEVGQAMMIIATFLMVDTNGLACCANKVEADCKA